MSAAPVLITGASGGIGADLARVFAAHGHASALVARDGPAMERLADEIAAGGGPRPLVIAMDLSEPGAADALTQRLAALNFNPAILVNNAGYGMLGDTATLDRAQQINMIDLNVRALTDLTLALLPAIIAARGRIMNVASVAGFYPGPGMNVYYATKNFVVAFGVALGAELKGQGVTVTTLCPGPTRTGFMRRAGAEKAMIASLGAMDSPAVARAGYEGLMAGRRVVTPGLSNKMFVLLSGVGPRALSLAIIGRLQRRRRR